MSYFYTITLHGYKSNKEFHLNPNLFERIEPVVNTKTNHTNIYIGGINYINPDGTRQPNYEVKETLEQIEALCKEKTSFNL